MNITNLPPIEETTVSGVRLQKKPNHDHYTKPKIVPSGDSYTCQNPSEMRQKLQCAKKHGTCGNLQYLPESGFWIFTKKAQYAYTCNGTETPKTIREMFGLKDGALRRCDSYIFDANRPYEKNHVVYFYEEDIKK